MESSGLRQLEGGKLALAELTLSRLVELKEDQGSAHNALGIAALMRGDATAAAQAYERALKAAPDFEKARVNLAALKCRFGDKEAARKELAGAKGPGALAGADLDPYWKTCR
jgi:Flp pilus assembly protein TadD